MRTTKKSAVLAAVLMAGLMLVGTACGGSSNKSDSASSSGSSSESSSATTAKSSGGDASSCLDLFNKTEELSTKMDAMMTDSTGSSSDLSAMVSALDSFTSSVPSAIRDDWKTIVSGIKSYADAIKGVDMNNLMDPATQDKLMKAAASMEDAKFQKASDNLDAWVAKNCPSYANK